MRILIDKNAESLKYVMCLLNLLVLRVTG
jgi:hypothetical protein